MGFKFIVFFVLVLIFVSIVSPACVNTSCECKKPQGQYCGGQIGCDPTHVYECNPSGGTCDYGYRGTCAKCGSLTCPPPRPAPTCRRKRYIPP